MLARSASPQTSSRVTVYKMSFKNVRIIDSFRWSMQSMGESTDVGYTRAIVQLTTTPRISTAQRRQTRAQTGSRSSSTFST